MPISTLIVDDAAEIRTMLRIALRARGGFEVVGEAATGAHAIELAADLRPDVVVLDLGLPDLASKDLMARMRRSSPTSRIVIYSGSDTDRPWFEQRASGYVLKSADIEHLVGLLESLGSNQVHDQATFELPQDLLAAREARDVVRGVLERWGYRDLIDDAILIVSELVTNAVRHAGSTSAVVVHRSEGGVRLEVIDNGAGSPQLGTPGSDAEGGRGLMIVTSLSTAWGLTATEESKTIWVELTKRD